MTTDEIIAEIQRRRAERGVSVADLANSIGVSTSNAYAKLNGRREMSVADADAMLRALGRELRTGPLHKH